MAVFSNLERNSSSHRQVSDVEVVRRLVEEKDIRIAEERLGQKDAHLEPAFELAHLKRVHFRRNPEIGQQFGGVRFRIPAAHFRKLAFELGNAQAVRVRKVRFGADRILFPHQIVKSFVPHDDRRQDGIRVERELVLLEDRQSLAFRDGDLACGRVNLSGEDIEERGFARTIGADEAVAIAGGEDDVDLGKEFPLAELQRHIADGDHVSTPQG